jgi:putative transcriptional regulator
MKTVRLEIDALNLTGNLSGSIDTRRVDATTEADIARHKAADDADAMLDAAKFARRVRRRSGFIQAEFAESDDISLNTIRNWEQGRRSPTGAAKALLKILDKAPEAMIPALH